MDRALQRHRGRRRHIRDCIYRRRVMAGTGRRVCPEVPSGLPVAAVARRSIVRMTHGRRLDRGNLSALSLAWSELALP